MNPNPKKLLRQAYRILLAGEDWKSVANNLLKMNKGTSQFDLHYRAYLRAILQGQPTIQLLKFDGAKAARQDLIDAYGKPHGLPHMAVLRVSPALEDLEEASKIVFTLRAEINGAIRKVLVQKARMSATDAGKFVNRAERNVRDIEKLLEEELGRLGYLGY